MYVSYTLYAKKNVIPTVSMFFRLLCGGLSGLFLEGRGKSSFLSLVGGMISDAGGFKPDVKPGLKVRA